MTAPQDPYAVPGPSEDAGDPGAPAGDPQPGGGESAPGAEESVDYKALYEEAERARRAAEDESNRSKAMLASVYGSQGDGYGRGEAQGPWFEEPQPQPQPAPAPAPQPSGEGDLDFESLERDYQIDARYSRTLAERIERRARTAAQQAAEQAAAKVARMAEARRRLDELQRQFYADYPELHQHTGTVQLVTQEMLRNPANGRRTLVEMIPEIAVESARRARVQLSKAPQGAPNGGQPPPAQEPGVAFKPTGDADQAHTAPGGTAAPRRTAPRREVSQEQAQDDYLHQWDSFQDKRRTVR